MKSALLSMIDYYLSDRSLQRETIFNIPTFNIPGSELELFDTLTSIELHEHKYKIISYGCSLNVSNDQLEGQSCLSRYGFDSPQQTTLESQSWQNQEPTSIIHSRIVSQLCRRLDLTPNPVDIPFLASKLHTTIPTEDLSFDSHSRGELGFASTQTRGETSRLRNLATPMDLDSKALRKLKINAEGTGQEVDEGDGETSFVPSWGQYVRQAMLDYRVLSRSRITKTQTEVRTPASEESESDRDAGMADTYGDSKSNRTAGMTVVDNGETPFVSAVREEVRKDSMMDRAYETDSLKPPPKVLEDIIQWSTDVDFSFSPYIHQRRSVVSPREVRDHEYLGDPSRSDDDLLDSAVQTKPYDTEEKRQIIQKMQLRGEDRI